MPYSLLLASQSEDERVAVQEALRGAPDFPLVAVVRRPEWLEEALAEHNPTVVLIASEFAGAQTIGLVERLSARVPLQVIVLLPLEDNRLVRQFIRAGALDAIPLPLLAQELIPTLRSAIQRIQRIQNLLTPASERERPPGRIIAFYGPKGGMGTSLICANLAVALSAHSDDPVVLVDLNLQFGNLDMLLNLEPRETIASLAQRFQGELDWEGLQPFLMTHADSPLKVLLAPVRPELAELVTVHLVEQVLQVLKAHFAYILIDLPTILQDTTLAALDVADYILLVIALDLLALRNAQKILGMFQRLYAPERLKLVLNRANVRFGGLSPEQAEEALGMPFIVHIPSDGRLAVTSLNEGTPFVLTSPTSELAQSIFRLATLLTGKKLSPPTPSSSASGGVLTRVVRFLMGEE